MAGVFIMLAVGIAIVLIFISWYYIATQIKLQKHQSEWDKIKQQLRQEDIENNYHEYCERLYIRERNTMVGACFPRK